MIVVEGLDGTGKTTLVGKLQEHFPDLLARPSIGNIHPSAEELVNQAILETGQMPYLLTDRCRTISEYVYTPVLQNRPTAWGVKFELWLLGRLLDHTTLVIWCQRPYASIRGAVEGSDQLAGVLENLPALATAYDHMMGFLELMFGVVDNGSKVVRYNFESPMSYESILPYVGEYLLKVSDEVRVE